MNIEVSNIYKRARELKGLTQEEAAEIMEISTRSISNYETSKKIPSNEVVAKMVKAYDALWLAFMHVMQDQHLGNHFPTVDISDLAKAVLRFQKRFADVKQKTPDMIEIACDGVVDKSEEETWNEVVDVIREFIGAGISVVYSKNIC